jgi:predicted house-cleaning noncanonical NTP pyrophosphatase (MazG superfamily)
MKTIGLIDYYISEWHANKYPKWIKEICDESGEDFVIKYGYAEEYVSKVDGKNTDEWCKEFGVEKCESIQELCEKADYILVLSPSNPEKHLGYAQEVLKYKKNTYIDKTFAPDYATAKEIFDIAEKCGTKFFSSSALRYSDELTALINSQAVITFGGGSNIDEYIIHQIEMLVKTINDTPKAVRVEQQANQYVVSVEFESGKKGTMLFSEALGFSVCVDNANGTPVYKKMESDFFKNLLKDILRFYKTGEVSFDVNQTLSVMKIREAVIVGKTKLGEWIQL